MKCKNCGKDIPGDSAFCPNCGNPINSIERCKKKFELKNLSLKSILVIIAIGIWMLVLQNLGIIPVTQDVRVKNTVEVSGNVDVDNTVDVSGDVDISGNVDVSGSTVSIE